MNPPATTTFFFPRPASRPEATPLRPVLVLATLTLLAPLALAQEHEHAAGDGMAWVLHDGPADGRAIVGGSTHFGFALLDHEGAPLPHRDGAFEVTQDGVTLFATQDAHEYDGLFSFDVTFTREGPYTVTATSEGVTSVAFEGVAVRPVDATVARIEFEPGDAPANAVGGTLSIVDANGTLVPHSDALVEFRRASDLTLVARVHLHVHEEPMAFTQGLGAGGEFLMQVSANVAYPSRDSGIRAAYAEFPVTARGVALPGLVGAPEAPALLEPTGASASNDGYALHGMYDPQNQVGLGQMARLAAVIVNATGVPEAHVDFAFTATGPRGLVFASESLHEYDGVFEYQFVPDAPGLYEATLTASTDAGELTIPYRLQVLPPVAPISGAGQGVVTVSGLEGLLAGVPTELTFRIAGPQGAVQHSEVDVTIAHEGEAPAMRFKLHTHGSGDTRALVTFPHAADWVVTVDPLPTLPQAVVFQGPDGPGRPIRFAASVAAGDEVQEVALPEDAQLPVPVPAALALAALAAVALLARRR